MCLVPLAVRVIICLIVRENVILWEDKVEEEERARDWETTERGHLECFFVCSSFAS